MNLHTIALVIFIRRCPALELAIAKVLSGQPFFLNRSQHGKSMHVTQKELPSSKISSTLNEPHHEKTCFCHMQTTKAQISLDSIIPLVSISKISRL